MKSCARREVRFFLSVLVLLLSITLPCKTYAQAVPYARTFAKPSEEVHAALQEMQAYAGQKLPIVEGFVAAQDRSLERFERAFYQFSIDLVPETSGGTIVRVTAKITAWYADRDPAKSGYQVLPSNGRLELDLLDRLTEKFGGSGSLRSSVASPQPKLDLHTASGIPVARPVGEARNPGTSSTVGAEPLAGSDEIVALKAKRAGEEKRLQNLNTELQNLQEIQRNQAHPTNLVVVKKTGTPVYSRAATGSRVLFTAAGDDEFEFLDAESDWIHVQISGASRGYLRRGSVELPEGIAARVNAAEENNTGGTHDAFRITQQETGAFPGNWETLRGKQVRIFTVQPVSADPKLSGPVAKTEMAITLFRKFSSDTPESEIEPAGVVIIFDSADGGIAAAPMAAIRQLAGKTLSRDAFLNGCYFEPPESFQSGRKP